MMSNPTFAQIWATLSSIDCSAHTEEKNGLTYLSWAWAWGILMSKFPQAEWIELPPTDYADGTVSVGCIIKIGECSRTMRLPVMDHRNKAIPNPDACARNKADMRVMTKCLALFGLGHYIYAGEDVPTTTPPLTPTQIARIASLLTQCPEGTGDRMLQQFPDANDIADLPAHKYDSICKKLQLNATKAAAENANSARERADGEVVMET